MSGSILDLQHQFTELNSYKSYFKVPTAKFKTYCSLNLKMWPFDQQKCEVKFGSWTYDAYQLKLRLSDSPIEVSWTFHSQSLAYTIKFFCSLLNLHSKIHYTYIFILLQTKHYYKDSEWTIVDSNAEYHSRHYDCCPEPYEDISK